MQQLSRANKTGDEAHPQPSIAFAQGPGGLVHRQRLGVAVRARRRRRATPKSLARRWAHTRCRATSRAGTCRRSSAAPTSAIPVTSKQQGPGGRLDQGVHGHRLAAEHRQGRATSPTRRRSPNINAGNPKLAPFAKAAKYSWFVPTAPELGQRRERERAAEHAPSIFTNRGSVKAAATDAQQADHEDPQRQVVTLPAGKRELRHELRLPGRRGRRRRRPPSRRRRASRLARSPLVRAPYLLLAAGGGRDRRRPRLPALLPGPAVVRAVRPSS